mmetsp:Transcript_30732/g.29606  ORF Transcript_30732/g.29606 Transcript_30732/m.29606 type:complete len:190 (-) Transcript_30732:17-586(-)
MLVSTASARCLLGRNNNMIRKSIAFSRQANNQCQRHHYAPLPQPVIRSSSRVMTSSSSNSSKQPTSFLQRFLGPKEMPPRGTLRWYGEVSLICTVFAITGTSTMVLVRPAVSKGLGLEGSFKDGPWSYRICSLVIMSPIYSVLLVAVGTIFGRHFYFRHFAVKMVSRFGIPPELMDKQFHQTSKNFRKW